MQRIEDDNGYTEVYAWGADRFGQLGLGNKQTGRCYCIPRLCSFNIIIKHIACGEEHSGFITLSGQIFTMGSNNEGRLGIGDKRTKQSSTPCLVESLSKYKAISLSCGWGHSAAILDTGELYTWGVGEYGALGQESLETCWAPAKVTFSDLAKVTSVSCGTRHTAIVDDLGQLRMCGSGDAGQLGTGTREKEPLPVIIKALDKVIAASAGIFHTLVLNINGKVYAMGGNNFGQLGIGNKRSLNSPTKIKDLDTEFITKISAGHHSAALNDKGELFLWGTGQFGELLIPTKIAPIKGVIKDVSIGGCFGMALNSEGVLYSWGSNSSGELGVGDYDPRDKPAPIQSLLGKPVLNMCCGGFYAMALGKTNTKTRTPIKNKFDVSPIPEAKTHMKLDSMEKIDKSITFDKSADKGKQDLSSFKKNDEIQTLYDEERKKRKKAEADLFNLKDQIDELKKGKGGLTDLSEMLSGKMEENKRLKEKLQLLDDQLSNTQLDAAKGTTREREMELLRRENIKLNDEVKLAKDNNKSAESELKHLKEANISLQKENSKLNEQKNGDNRKLRDILKEYEVKIEKEIEDKHSVINEKAKEISKLLDAINDLEGRVADKDATIERLEKDSSSTIRKLEDELNLESSEKKRISDSANDMKKELELLNNDLNTKQEEIRGKDMQLADANAKIEKYMTDCAESDDQNKRLLEENNNLKDSISALEGANATLKADNAKLLDEVNALKDSKEKLEDELQNTLKDKNKEIDNCKASLLETEKKLNDLQTQYNDKVDENEDLLNKLKLSQNEIDTKGKEIDNEKANLLDMEKRLNDLQTLYNDKAYENEDLLNKINLKQTEIDTMIKEVEGWKQMADKLGLEGDELRKIIEDLEFKNKKLGETLNAQIYNRAAEYKEKVLNSLKNSQSPMRIQKLLNSGKKLNYPQPSPMRLEGMIKEENDKKTREGAVKDINKMIQFQAATTQNIKSSIDKNPMQTPSNLNTDYVVDQDNYKLENMNKDGNNLVNSNYDVIQSLNKKEDPTGELKVYPNENPIPESEEQKQEEDKQPTPPEYSTPSKEEPVEAQINKSVKKLSNLLGIESPIRQKIAQQALGGKVPQQTKEALITPILPPEQKSPGEDYSFRGSGGTTVTGSIVKASLNLAKQQLSKAQDDKQKLENDLLNIEKRIAEEKKE